MCEKYFSFLGASCFLGVRHGHHDDTGERWRKLRRRDRGGRGGGGGGEGENKCFHSSTTSDTITKSNPRTQSLKLDSSTAKCTEQVEIIPKVAASQCARAEADKGSSRGYRKTPCNALIAKSCEPIKRLILLVVKSFLLRPSAVCVGRNVLPVVCLCASITVFVSIPVFSYLPFPIPISLFNLRLCRLTASFSTSLFSPLSPLETSFFRKRNRKVACLRPAPNMSFATSLFLPTTHC